MVRPRSPYFKIQGSCLCFSRGSRTPDLDTREADVKIAPPDKDIDCNSSGRACFLAECWQGNNNTAVVVKLPTFVPIPVEADPETFPIFNLIRHKRDFGITAAIITAIVASAVAATTVAIAMTNQVQTAEAVNNIVEQTVTALTTQEEFNAYLASGLLIANQRINLVQEQVEELYKVVQMSCVSSLKGLCITPSTS